MTLKIAFLALALLVAWMLFFRPRRVRPKVFDGRRTASRGRAQAPQTTAFERCPRCGTYRLPDGPCACDPSEAAER